MRFQMMPRGAFTLMNENQYFGGWLTVGADQAAIAMAFPVEGWQQSAAVVLRQQGQQIVGEVYGGDEAAWQQALAALSLDENGAGWPQVGGRDAVIGKLQERYQYLRPVLFHSPYEAAAAFIIGHRISIQQGRAIRQRMAQEIGELVQAGDAQLYAFPRPQVLCDLTEFPGVSAEKIERLHGMADAALEGWLDRGYLRSLPVDEALAKLRTLRGVGEFFAQGILYRGAGLVDVLTDDEVTRQAVQAAYGLPQLPDQAAVRDLAEAWRPYRMWTTVLLHAWFRREAGGPKRERRR